MSCESTRSAKLQTNRHQHQPRIVHGITHDLIFGGVRNADNALLAAFAAPSRVRGLLFAATSSRADRLIGDSEACRFVAPAEAAFSLPAGALKMLLLLNFALASLLSESSASLSGICLVVTTCVTFLEKNDSVF